MNKKTKRFLIGTMTAAVVASGAISLTNTSGAFAAAAKPAPAAVDTRHDGITTTQGDLTITISGGHVTDPRDKGRPVVLIASALGVPSEVFRDAFSGVTPAGLDRNPTPVEAQRNKAALLKVLGPYGITNDRLDEVSNFYRYNGKTSKTWRVTPATVKAIETDGVVTGIQIINPGAGYSSNPLITVKGPNGTVTATTTVSYTEDFTTNGSLASVTLHTK